MTAPSGPGLRVIEGTGGDNGWKILRRLGHSPRLAGQDRRGVGLCGRVDATLHTNAGDASDSGVEELDRGRFVAARGDEGSGGAWSNCVTLNGRAASNYIASGRCSSTWSGGRLYWFSVVGSIGVDFAGMARVKLRRPVEGTALSQGHAEP
jgi:hypothetical protein